MRSSSALGFGLAIAMLAGGAAQAKSPGAGSRDAKIGMGMICDSQVQAARFLELRAAGRKADEAMAVVNKESRNAKACGLAVIAFTEDATLVSKSVDNRLVQVIRIRIVAGYTGATWQKIKNFTQYAVIEADGIDV